MYESKKITICILAFLLSVSVIWGSILSYRLEQNRRQLEYYRAEYTTASNRQQLLADTVDECAVRVERTGEILGRTATSIQELREQLREVRESYQDMEDRLYKFYDLYRDNDNTAIEEIN